ncbi:hypothetical protein GCM10012275_57650 [Longimycelium tulufanense]|uniref:Uncharacterized protein n=1 Tax=Longimycelium tulufanense TaxID=907463 RepID=A0A8J3CDS6_9PSEU|nr:hypothetical protein [Longimycelium tulufanense]GGM79497.1 hypothetical protein GCM10012275_57650 [Longimycelium tulufanense]
MGILEPVDAAQRRSTATAEVEEAARQEAEGLHRQLVRLFLRVERVYFKTDPDHGYTPLVVERGGRQWVDAYLHEQQIAEYGELPERSWCSGQQLRDRVHEQFGPGVGITLLSPQGVRLPVVEPMVAPVSADADGSEVSA